MRAENIVFSIDCFDGRVMDSYAGGDRTGWNILPCGHVVFREAANGRGESQDHAKNQRNCSHCHFTSK